MLIEELTVWVAFKGQPKVEVKQREHEAFRATNGNFGRVREPSFAAKTV
jgi:hypothetical protein